MDFLPLVFGAIVGISLGLTGGGGSIFAVPLLIYGLGVGVRESVGVSLLAVGVTALFGAVLRLKSGSVEVSTSLFFSVAGMIGAPVGTKLGGLLPDSITLSLFAGLMIVVGHRMWIGKSDSQNPPFCERIDGKLVWNSRCVFLLILFGIITGVLSGVFGVGGGFIIVPVLVLVTGMSIHIAIGSSLLCIGLVCVSGVGSFLLRGSHFPLELTALFLGGGGIGIFIGTLTAKRLHGQALKRVFAASMWFVAAFILVKNLFIWLPG